MQLYITEQQIQSRAIRTFFGGEKEKKKGSQFQFLLLVCLVVSGSLRSFPVFCKGDVYFIKITIARQQIGHLSGNGDEVESCRFPYGKERHRKPEMHNLSKS